MGEDSEDNNGQEALVLVPRLVHVRHVAEKSLSTK